MKIYAKRKVRPFHDNGIWGENEMAQEFKKLCDTPECRMYSGRRIFRLLNTPKLRYLLSAAKHTGNF